MKTKHTPGPWQAVEMGVIADTISTHGNFYVCSLIDPDNPQDKANARLIAAAPAMLEALQQLVYDCHEYAKVNRVGNNVPFIQSCNNAKTVIAQAESET